MCSSSLVRLPTRRSLWDWDGRCLVLRLTLWLLLGAGLYDIPPDGTDEYKVWEDRVWQASQERLGNEQKEYQDDADREVAEVYHLADIDRDKQGIVTIDWPEFLEIVAKLQNPRKCRGGKPGLVRLRPEASRPSSSSS